MLSGRLKRRCISDMKALARVAHKLVATDFAKKGKRGIEANGKYGPRGTIGNIGHRFRRQGRKNDLGWGPYAPKRGREKEHGELFKAAQRVTAAMADADYDYNVAEQTALEAKVVRIYGKQGMPKDVRQLLDRRYIAATIGRGAGNPQHTDPHDCGGGLFAKIGEGPCMFALPEFQVYVQANKGDVLYINTPVVLHGACVPPEAAHAKRAGLAWGAKEASQVARLNASWQEHLTYGVYTRGDEH